MHGDAIGMMVGPVVKCASSHGRHAPVAAKCVWRASPEWRHLPVVCPAKTTEAESAGSPTRADLHLREAEGGSWRTPSYQIFSFKCLLKPASLNPEVLTRSGSRA